MINELSDQLRISWIFWINSNSCISKHSFRTGCCDLNKPAGISKGVATWGAAQDVSPAGSIAGRPQVALSLDGGTATAVWGDQDPASNGGVVATRTAVITGAIADWGSGPDVLSGARGGWAPHVAISRDGTTAVTVWTATWPDNGIGYGIAQSRAASINAGSTTWSNMQDLSTPIELTSVGSDVALSADGTTAVAVWSFGSVNSRRASVSAGTATWKRTQPVSAKGAGPLIGLSRDGRTAVSVWNRSDGTRKFATYLQSATAWAPQ